MAHLKTKLLHWKIVFLLIWVALFLMTAAVSAQPPSPNPPNEAGVDGERVQEILLLLSHQAFLTQKELDALQKLPPSRKVNQRKDDLLDQLDGLNRNFESIATQQNAEELLREDSEKSDWVRELEALTLPILEAMSDLTKKPRRIDQLKKRIEALEVQLDQFEKGSANIRSLLKMGVPDAEVKKEEEELYLNQLHRLDTKFNPDMVRLKLEEAQKSLESELRDSESIWETLSRATQSFFKHRGLNLLITIALFLGLWFILSKLRIFIIGPKSIFKVPVWMKKVLATAYSILVLIICVISSLVALYLLNDWLLLSVIILFIAALAWASRQFIPRMFMEVRLALNLGTVKENERLIWNGVPWEVKSIGLQAVLENPLLDGGTVYLPVGELIGKYSRPLVENEPWFPTRLGEWVFLSDGTYGKIENQTVEQVVLRLKGGTHKFYSTPGFLTQTPMNLTHGFRFDLEFALDYGLQSRICDEVPSIFEKGIRKHLDFRFAGDNPEFQFLDVSFDQAASSSLNLKIIINVHGRCAEDYGEIQREIQTALVRVCNENEFVIPFTQLTVNLAEETQLRTGSPATPKDDSSNRV